MSLSKSESMTDLAFVEFMINAGEREEKEKEQAKDDVLKHLPDELIDYIKSFVPKGSDANDGLIMACIKPAPAPKLANLERVEYMLALGAYKW